MTAASRDQEQIQGLIKTKCPHCKATDFVKYGTYKGTQLYWCKPCQRKFTASGAMPGRRIPPDQVGAAISMFYGGLSVAAITRQMDWLYGFRPSTATVYEWVVDYTRLARDRLQPFKARTGDTWVADEMVVRIGGEKLWVWTVMDAKTRMILASHISPTRTIHDAVALFGRAKEAARRPPKRIITDRLAAYADGIERVFGADTRHVQSEGMRAPIHNNLAERLQGTIRARSKVMRGMKSRRTASLVMDGWMIHYNFFRPHESLGNRTPAEVADIEAPFSEWEEVAQYDVRPFSQIRVRREFRDRTLRRRDRTLLRRLR